MDSLHYFWATIGQDPQVGYQRFTFGNLHLYAGISLVPILIGLFSFPEVLQMLETDGEGFSEVNEAGKLYLKANDFLKNKLTLIRSTIIGVVIGIIPARARISQLSYLIMKRKKHLRNPRNLEMDQ